MTLVRMTINKSRLAKKEPAVRINEDGKAIRFAREVKIKGPSRLWCPNPLSRAIVLDTESEIELI